MRLHGPRCAAAASVAGASRRIRRRRHRIRRAAVRRAVHNVPRRERRRRGRRRPAQRAFPQREVPIRISIRVVTTGIPGTGMLAFTFDPSEIAGIVAYLRNMNSFDRGSISAGDAARGRAGRRRKGRLPPMPPRRRAGLARGAGSERNRSRAQRRIAAAFAGRSEQPDDADQPAGPRRHEGRQGDQRTPAQRGHLHRAADRRCRSSWSR